MDSLNKTMIRVRQQPFELFDETLDINATDNYDLAVEISDDGIAYSVLDLLRSKFVLLRHYQPEKEETNNSIAPAEVLAGDDFLRRPYRKVFVITPCADSTLIPNPLYDSSLKDDYYRFNLQYDGDEPVLSNTLPTPGAALLFSPPAETRGMISARWPGITPWHQVKPLLSHAFTASRSSETHYIHLHIETGYINIIILTDRNLTFCNSYRCSTPSDISYYLFSVLNTLKVSNDESVYLSGIVEPYGELHLSLLEFTHQIHFTTPLVRYGFSYVFNDSHLHRYINIFTASSCE